MLFDNKNCHKEMRWSLLVCVIEKNLWYLIELGYYCDVISRSDYITHPNRLPLLTRQRRWLNQPRCSQRQRPIKEDGCTKVRNRIFRCSFWIANTAASCMGAYRSTKKFSWGARETHSQQKIWYNFVPLDHKSKKDDNSLSHHGMFPRRLLCHTIEENYEEIWRQGLLDRWVYWIHPVIRHRYPEFR